VFAVARTAEGFASQVLGPPDFARKADLERDVAEVARRLDDPELDYAASLDLIGEQRELEDEIAALARGVALPLAIAPGEDGADVRIGAETQRVALGAWSEPFHPVFALSHGIEVHALTRVKLVALEPLRLYVHRLDLDPAHAPFWQPASAPPAFAAELAAAHGPFETYGWTTATMPYKDGEADAATVIESAGWTLERERELWRGAVAREDWRLLIGTFGVGTHLRSVLTHLAEPGHPLHDAGAAAATARFLGADVRAGGAVDAAYAALDALVGETRAKLREGDVLLVVSPNGIASFRRQVHLNNWLAAEGFLTPGSRSANGLASVDWGATRAYALGLGGIHLNLAGREAQGIVAEDDANDVLDAIAEKLLAARDPETGAPLVTAVHRPRELWSGVHAEMLPDLVVGFAPPYRVSWATTLGGVAYDGAEEDATLAPFVADNDRPWTGGEASVDPAAIEGVLVASVPLRAEGDGALDVRVLAPTVLSLLGVEVPGELDLAPLEVR
jgi:predicted AlkP superfamily phosphohydrolase/phosphomutase